MNSTKPNCISIIIPVYNEQNRISKTLTTLTDYLSKQEYVWEIVIVNDGSQDDTLKEVELFSKDSRIRLIDLPHSGKGAAIKEGMLSAYGEIRIMCDADMAMPVRHISDFIYEIKHKNHDVVIGSRQIYGSKRFNESNFRHLIGRIYNCWIKFFLIADYLDTQCGFKAFTEDSANQIFPLQQLKGFGFDVEILVIANLKELKTKELPIEWYHNEESKVNPVMDSIRMFLDTIKIKTSIYKGKYNH
ncbi:MAG: dolichyl-phosphate beta-glucosyltransferase [Chloroflexota bacterium]